MPVGISDATFYNWKSKYNGISASDLKRSKDLEAENARLKKKYAYFSLPHDALKGAVEKKALTPAEKRRLVTHINTE